LYFSPDIRMIKPRSMRWAKHEAHKGEMRNVHKNDRKTIKEDAVWETWTKMARITL